MVIYVDLIFLLNIFLDFFLLMSISVILTRNTKFRRLLMGSIVGGGTSFLLFINVNVVMSLLLKIVFGLLMIIVTFGYKSIKYTMNNMFYLLCLSFSVGGVMYLLMDNKLYNYIVLIIGFIIVLFMYVKNLKKFKNNYANYYKVNIFIKDREYNLIGFLDTGNKLYDRYRHRPVIIISKKIKYSLEDIIYVPYKSLNNNSVLKCIKTDKIVINNHIFKNYLVGFSDKKIDIDGINCILHSKMKGDLNA